MTVAELLDRVSARELTEWMVVYKLRNNEREKANRQQG